MIMKEYLQHYQMKITALSPIHIGNGVLIGKKEYIQKSPNQPVIIPDLSKMLYDLQLLHKEVAFQKYMLGSTKDGLGQWLKQEGIPEERIRSWKKYSLYAGDAFIKPENGKAATPKGIMAFVKDAYGIPYVPGSSIKGMIRTALLAMEIQKNPQQFSRIKKAIDDITGRYVRPGKPLKTYLKRETDQLEAEAFHVLERDERKMNAVNSCLSGLIISDSNPIELTNLTLSQKIDYSLAGKERSLPILRESLIPGTEIFFELTIDTSVCKYTIQDILKALDQFQECSYRYFYSRFRRGSRASGTVWLGGGTGFLSKTILYPFFEGDAVKVADAVFKNTLGKNYDVHKHNQDISKHLSPHMCKCTKYHGQLYDMGMGRIEVISQ